MNMNRLNMNDVWSILEQEWIIISCTYVWMNIIFLLLIKAMYSNPRLDPLYLKLDFKGQLISKCLFGVYNFLPKRNKNTSHSSKNEFIHSFFLEEFTAWQFAFEIKWPLVTYKIPSFLETLLVIANLDTIWHFSQYVLYTSLFFV